MKTLKLSILFIFLSGLFVSAAGQAPLRGGPLGGERPLVKDFDTNKDGWLNAAERKPARVFAASSGLGRGGRGGRGRGFAAPTEPGATLTPSDVKAYPNTPFYDETILRTL